MKEILEELKKLSRDCNKLTKLLNSYSKLLEKPVDNVYLREKKIAEISKLFADIPDSQLKADLKTWFQNEHKELQKHKDDFKFEFGEKLKEMFQKDNIAVRGQYPKLRIAIFTLVVNFEFGEAELFFGPEVEKIKGKIPLQPQAVFEAVKKCRDDLIPKKFDGQEFYNSLLTAYKKRLGPAGKNMGDKMLIVDLLHGYVLLQQSEKFFEDPRKEHFREYPRNTLSYMLYLLRKSGIADKGIRFYVATFDATTEKKSALWVPDNDEGDGTYYSYVSF